MNDIHIIRRTVATMANQLHKLGYPLSNAFKTAWKRVKESMTCRVSSVTYGKRQKLLQFIANRKPEDRLCAHWISAKWIIPESGKSDRQGYRTAGGCKGDRRVRL